VRINEELLERKLAAPIKRTEINDYKGSAVLTTRHPSIHKSGQVLVAQSVYFACGLKATEFAFLLALQDKGSVFRPILRVMRPGSIEK
jgi:hypothetical protein